MTEIHSTYDLTLKYCDFVFSTVHTAWRKKVGKGRYAEDTFLNGQAFQFLPGCIFSGTINKPLDVPLEA